MADDVTREFSRNVTDRAQDSSEVLIRAHAQEIDYIDRITVVNPADLIHVDRIVNDLGHETSVQSSISVHSLDALLSGVQRTFLELEPAKNQEKQLVQYICICNSNVEIHKCNFPRCNFNKFGLSCSTSYFKHKMQVFQSC